MSGVVHWLLKVLKKAGWFHLLSYILCISFFSAQMVRLVENLVVPKMTHTSVREVPLKDIEFPLDLKLCVRPSMNSAALEGFGYEKAGLHYVSGSSSRTNYSYIGWGGHDLNGRNLTSAREVFKKAKLNVTTGILREAWISTYEDDLIMIQLSDADLVKINRLDDCHILKLDPQSMKGMKDITITFNEIMGQNLSLELKLQGQGLTTHREIQKHRFDSFGDNMKVNRFSMYVVKIRETVFVEEDPSQSCCNYPTSEFASYTECDDNYVRKRIDQFSPGLNLTPVWLTDDLDMVTTLPLPNTNKRMLGKQFSCVS